MASYQVLSINADAATATVELNDDNGHILNQDFPLGSSPDDLTNSITDGLVVFLDEITANAPVDTSAYDSLVGVDQTISDQTIQTAKNTLDQISQRIEQ